MASAPPEIRLRYALDHLRAAGYATRDSRNWNDPSPDDAGKTTVTVQEGEWEFRSDDRGLLPVSHQIRVLGAPDELEHQEAVSDVCYEMARHGVVTLSDGRDGSLCVEGFLDTDLPGPPPRPPLVRIAPTWIAEQQAAEAIRQGVSPVSLLLDDE